MTDPAERGDLDPADREMTSADLTAHDPDHGQVPHVDDRELESSIEEDSAQEDSAQEDSAQEGGRAPADRSAGGSGSAEG